MKVHLIRLVGALMLEQNDEWSLERCPEAKNLGQTWGNARCL